MPCTAIVGKLSFLGNYDGIRVLPDWWDLGLVVVFSVAVFFIGVCRRPTFFVDGRRHTGPHDADTLAAALLAARSRERPPTRWRRPGRR